MTSRATMSQGSATPKDEDEVVVRKATPSGPFNNPFARLKSHPLAAASGASSDLPVKTPDSKRVPAPARALVRMERKGHGGKEVTVVEQLGLSTRDLERWLKSLKQSLGCGGTVDGASIVLQGDHRERLRELLQGRGVRKVSLA